ncbi:MAG: hypothetical protein EXS24_04060 [Pedosphaera sp.]|nr:hypothetical protein [Pedosphaera sp.]
MNQILKLFLLMWFSFGGGMSLFFTWKYGYKSGVIGGVVSGFLFAGFMSAFAIYQARQFRGPMSVDRRRDAFERRIGEPLCRCGRSWRLALSHFCAHSFPAAQI